jgi:hypothetical protein
VIRQRAAFTSPLATGSGHPRARCARAMRSPACLWSCPPPGSPVHRRRPRATSQDSGSPCRALQQGPTTGLTRTVASRASHLIVHRHEGRLCANAAQPRALGETLRKSTAEVARAIGNPCRPRAIAFDYSTSTSSLQRPVAPDTDVRRAGLHGNALGVSLWLAEQGPEGAAERSGASRRATQAMRRDRVPPTRARGTIQRECVLGLRAPGMAFLS